ncbi:MAG: alkyl hydroperoxide reductase, partial [Pseudomonadota bacterium]
MSLQSLRDQIPDYAKDIRLNLGSLATETVLNDQQKYGTFLASAMASRNADVIKAISEEVSDKLSPEAVTAANAAASIMGMNNIYYRFTHMVSEKSY